MGHVIAMAFDSLKFAQTLREKGQLSAAQAEGITEAFSAASRDDLVTKTDLQLESSGIRSEISSIRHEVNLLKWMTGFLMTMQVAIFLKLFLK